MVQQEAGAKGVKQAKEVGNSVRSRLRSSGDKGEGEGKGEEWT